MGAVVADYLCSCLKAASLNQILKSSPCRVDLGKLPPCCWECYLLPLGLTCPRELQAQGLSPRVMTKEDSMIPPLFLNNSQSKLLHRSSRIAQKYIATPNEEFFEDQDRNKQCRLVYGILRCGWVFVRLCACVFKFGSVRVWQVLRVGRVYLHVCACVSPVSVSVSVSVNVFRFVPLIFKSAICLVHVPKHATLSCMVHCSLTSPQYVKISAVA